ncbi:MAG: glycosyltransferase family 4 protein [Solirubrobacterales bacterium]
MGRRAHKHDLAIYAPASNGFYEREGGLQLGGREVQAVQVAKGLAGEGLAVAHIVYPVDDPESPAVGLDIVQRPAYQASGGPVGRLREGMAIWRSLSAADAEVYILRGHGMYLVVGAVFGRIRRRQVLVSGSNDIDFMPRLRGGSRLKAWVFRWSIKAADAVVAQTAQQRDVATREFPRLRNLSVIPNFAEPAEPASGQPKAFLWVGRLVDYKRPLKYIELAEAVPEARFWMIVLETNETRAALDQQVRTRAQEVGNLEMLSPRPRPELMRLLPEAAAIVLTSEYEGMPNVFLEAWMRSIPVVSLGFDPDGSIEREGMGLAAEDDWDRFVEAVARLWSDPELRTTLGAAGRRYAQSEHDPAAVSGRWASVVRALLP